MKLLKLLSILFIFGQCGYGQNVGIGTSNPNSTLTVTESSSPTIKIGGTQTNTINSGTLIFAEDVNAAPYTGFSISHDAQNDKLNFRRRLNSSNFSIFDFRNNNEMHIHGSLYTQSIIPQNIRLASGASDGAILISDVDGDMEWSSPSNFENVFKVNATSITNESNYDKDFIIGRNELPASLDVTDNFMFFDKDKAAFRAGELDNSDSWGESSIGLHSFAFGKNNEAKEIGTAAWGQNNRAISANSTVFGSNNVAGGDHSTVFGANNSTSGSTATAFGHNNSGQGVFSTVFGGRNFALGRYSTAFGLGNFARSFNEVAFGTYCTTYNSNNPHGWNVNDRLFVIGSGSDSESRQDALALWKSGQLGIGESNPEARVHIKSTAVEDPLAIDVNNERVLRMRFNGRIGIGENIPQARVHIKSEEFEAPLSVNIGNTKALHIDSDGQVGIGVDIPTAKVHVNSNNGEDPLAIYISNEKVLNIQSDGTLSLGPVSTPFAKLHLNSNIGENLIRAQANETTKFLVHSNGGIANYSTTPSFAFNLRNSATDLLGRGRAFSWNTYSDRRIKSEIRTIEYGLETIMALRPTSYQHHNTLSEEKSGVTRLSTTSTPDIGLIAQEVHKLVPESVSKPSSEKDLWSMDYARLVPVLIKGMQEQQEMIELLQKEIIDLKKAMKK